MKGAAALALVLAGCTCEGPGSVPPTTEALPPSEPAPPSAVLPAAGSTELPLATPMPTITVSADRFEVSNRVLVASWPPAEREAVGRTRPLGDAAYPVVERRVDDDTTALLVPELQAALSAIVEVDRVRASITHGGGTPTVFAIRAAPEVPFARVLSAVYAAGMVGLREPRMVLASPDGERMLALHTPSAEEEAADPELEAALAAALAPFRVGAPPESGVDAGLPPRALRTHVELDEAGVTFRRGAVRYGHGCREPAPAGEAAPSVPIAELAPSALRACLDALDAGPTIFRARRETSYADAVSVLEPLAAHGPVTLAAASP